MPGSEVNSAILEYRVTQLEKGQDDTVIHTTNMGEKVGELHTGQELIKQRMSIYVIILTLVLNGAVFFSEKFLLDKDDGASKQYYDMRVEHMKVIDKLNSRILELEKDK